MLSYRHAYHAGNHADILKHLSLIALLRHFNNKEAPYCYVDTHSGKGYYDLMSAMAEKNAEYQSGIGKVWGKKWQDPTLKTFMELLQNANGGKHAGLRHYLGSPAIARELCREQDKLILMEMHSQEFPQLKRNFGKDRRVHLHQRDGFEGLLAISPPEPRRGLVLIDPAYEVKSDYERVAATTEKLYRKWQTAVVAIWFPILGAARDRSEWLKKRFAKSGLSNILLLELNVAPQDPEQGMHGSGMIIINAPWQLDQTLTECLKLVGQNLDSSHPEPLRVEWLSTEV